MFLLRLVGVDMSDDASKTFGGGVRGWLGAGGFLLMMFGGYFLYEKGDFHVGIPMILGGLPLFILPWAWERFKAFFRSSPRPQQLEYLSAKDSDLGSAIKSMARRSAWGRWFSAQQLVNSGSPIDNLYLLQIAGSIVRDQMLDGNLEVRGRGPGKLEYEPIPQTHWQSSVLHFVDDPRSLWRMVILPTGGVEFARDGTIVRASDAAAAERTSQITNYDSFLVDACQFEKLWPQKDAEADRARIRFLRRARRRRLDKDEIQRLSEGRKLFLWSWFK
jgi:hypothetical protein